MYIELKLIRKDMVCINIRDYPTWTQTEVKEHRSYCCFPFHSRPRNEHFNLTGPNQILEYILIYSSK